MNHWLGVVASAAALAPRSGSSTALISDWMFPSPALGMYHACTSARKRAFTQEPVWRIVT